jgi:ADP-ribosylglycohydrolase
MIKLFGRLFNTQQNTQTIKATIYGLAIGDALGVPVEFSKREVLEHNPVTGMRAYGTHDQPKGTWSDDTSLTLCLLDSLSTGYDLKDMAIKFISWRDQGAYTANGHTFDIGFTTYNSIDHLIKALGQSTLLTQYSQDVMQNGNGSLMRIAPLYFYLKKNGLEMEYSFDIIYEVSALTHGHIRAAYACLLYFIFMDELESTKDKHQAYSNMQYRMKQFFQNRNVEDNEQILFNRILLTNLHELPKNEILSTGYVLNSLEASLWAFMKFDNYPDCVLQAINLGEDTDTNGAITGALAGLYYGYTSIPKSWIEPLCNKELIDTLLMKYDNYGR